MAYTLESLACLAARQGRAEVAARLFGATDTYLSASNMHLASIRVPFDPLWRQEHDHFIAGARTQLGEAAFVAAWTEGAAMTLKEAVGLVSQAF